MKEHESRRSPASQGKHVVASGRVVTDCSSMIPDFAESSQFAKWLTSRVQLARHRESKFPLGDCSQTGSDGTIRENNRVIQSFRSNVVSEKPFVVASLSRSAAISAMRKQGIYRESTTGNL